MSEATATVPLLENEHVKQLLSILKEHGGNQGDLLSMIGNVTTMEKQLDTAVEQLTAMRQELSELREIQNHPIKNALQKAVHALEKGIAETRERLDAVKESIINGCKSAVSAFKEKGISALNNLAGFFKIRRGLESVQNSLDRCIQDNNKTLNKIAAFSAEYHETGRHLKNMGRALLGKDTVQEAKPMGGLAKLAQAPVKVMRNTREGVKRGVTGAISSLEKLEQAAEKKPSVLGNLQTLKDQAAKTAQDAPKPERRKTQEAAI